MRKLNWSRRVPGGVLALAAGALLSTVPVAPAFAATTLGSTPLTITTVGGNGTAGPFGDGAPAVNAQLHHPDGAAVDVAGNLYIADSVNNRIRKVVNPTVIDADIISTVAGNGVSGFKGDGGPATLAELKGPASVAVDSSGDIFIADTGNNRIREVLPSGRIKTVAGSGRCGPGIPVGNGLPAVQASLCVPSGVAVDGHHLYVSDTGHSEVRVVNLTTGVVEDFAGTGKFGYTGDGGQATAATLGLPMGLAVDAAHRVLIADSGDSVVREVFSDGTIHTFAGNGRFGYSGDGGRATRAELNGPTGLGVDQGGDVYIADTLNNRIREVNAAGIISTAAGTGVHGFAGDGGPAGHARLAAPTGDVAVNSTAVYFADTGNQRIRGIFVGPPPVLPEVQWLVALPLSVLAVGAGAWLLGRRRVRRAAPGLTRQ
jgi:trimeric autotransporter adhesin